MIFVKRKASEPMFDVKTSLGLRKVYPFQVGLELEFEGNKFNKTKLPAPWTYHADGSLRGEDNAEYVLDGPIPFEKVPESLDVIWASMKEFGTVLAESNRTSIHVHLNVQDFYLNRVTTLMAMYFAFEEILTEWCGEFRVGNLFCLRAKDAPAIISHIRKFIQSDMEMPLRDGHHYAGLSAYAIQKLGSIEIRTLRGVNDPQPVKDWVGILRRFYELSADYTDPREFIEGFSGEGPMAFFNSILGDQAEVVRRGITMSDEDIRESLYEGIRLAQDLCYCRDWKRFETVNLKPDPFGRSAKVVLNRMQHTPSVADEPIGEMDLDELEIMQQQSPPFSSSANTIFNTIAQAQANVATPVPNSWWVDDEED